MGMVGANDAARKLAREAGVPVVPGSEGLIENEAEAISLANEFGFPVLVKASAGGGGRGMRVAVNDLALRSALQQASAEAEAAFHSPVDQDQGYKVRAQNFPPFWQRKQHQQHSCDQRKC